MKRIRLFKTIALLAIAFFAVAMGSAQAGKIPVTFAGTEAATTTQSKMMQAVADVLNADGRFDAKVLVAGALSGNTDALVTQAKLGIPLVVPSDPGRLASQFAIPDLNILMAPYILTDPAVLKNLPDTELFKEWSKKLEAQGIVFVANMYNGFRNFYTTKPVKTVKDLSGLRIRGFGNDIGNALAKYFGFANIAISFGEVFPAIQQKTLDGTEVQVSAAAGAAFWDVTKYIAMTKHYMLQTSFVCSTRLLNTMPQAAKDFFLKTIREKALEYGALAEKDEAGYYEQMRQRGVTINEVNIKEFQDAIAPLYTNNDLKFSPGLKEKLFKQLGM
ncbi:MAG: TRAP transporter substrate-binding protein DctP [Spirochaetia bacterium]|jgi:TRAP-type C4-dicarboxylate transport system substrate-binding protein|nr:TRAP transporter substrate-binding protein DctP [Spirochaetales bacterium]MDX9783599.1 TRAP transporter substrate-binding protein DctP [Spirochaetia bacterium]